MKNYLWSGTPRPIFTETHTGTAATVRPLNTNFVVSTEKDAFVSYSVRLSTTAALTVTGTATATATATLEIRPTPGTGAFSIIDRGRLENVQTATLVLTVTLSQTIVQEYALKGFIPAGYEAVIVTSTTGTASVTIATAGGNQVYQETLYG